MLPLFQLIGLLGKTCAKGLCPFQGLGIPFQARAVLQHIPYKHKPTETTKPVLLPRGASSQIKHRPHLSKSR